MKVVHSVYIEAFLYPTEDAKKVRKALDILLPPKAKLKKERINSFYGPEINKLYFETNKAEEIRAILGKIVSGLSREEKNEVIRTLDDRIDEEGNLFIRFDKQKAYTGQLILKYHGDVIKTRIKVSSFPSTLNNLKYNAKILFE